MKKLKIFSLVAVVVSLFMLLSCDRDIQVDYHTVCFYYIDNPLDNPRQFTIQHQQISHIPF